MRGRAAGPRVRVVAVIAAAAVGAFAVGCGDSGDDAACRGLRADYEELSAASDDALDELLAYREAVSLHDRIHHDLQFDYAKSVVQADAARLALVDADCEAG